MEKRAIIWLKIGFMFGAIVDALALMPMLIPRVSKMFWGIENFTGIYYFAQGMGAALMLGWTSLLLWAFQQPLQRRFVAVLTIVVIIGIVITQIFAIRMDYIEFSRLIGSFVLQAVLLAVFGYGFIVSHSPHANPGDAEYRI